jgi:lipoprotein-releasing system permease protein
MSAYSVQRTAEPRPILLEDSLITALENAPYTSAVFPGIQKSALLVNPSVDAFEGIQISGMSPERWSYFARHHTLDGPSNPTQRYGSFISKTLSRELGLYTGDTAVLVLLKNQRSAPRLRKSVIEGVYQTGLDEYNRSNILMNLEDVRRLQGWKNDSVSNYTVVLSDAQQRADLAAYWNAIVPYSIQVSSVEQKHPAIFGWLELFDTNIALVLGIVLIVALSNLVTALLVLIIDRTRMIGTLKALGSSNRLILQVFQWLSLRILGLGLLWGNAIGLGVSFIQWKFGVIHLDPETYYIATAPIAFDGWWILGANFGFLLIAYFVLRIPVAWIAKIDPIKSIRFA